MERNRQRTPDITAAGPHDAGLVDLEIGATGQQLGQRDARLHPGRRGTQTVMGAVAERQDVARAPGHVELTGVKGGINGKSATTPAGTVIHPVPGFSVTGGVIDLAAGVVGARIRDLAVEEVQGRVVVRGQVPSHHTKQLALHAALELVSSDRFSANITVG